MVRVAALIEQFWHKIPGGTARATAETLSSLAAFEDVDLVGVKAWHPRSNKTSYSVDFEIETIHLPRPSLYGRWLDNKSPSIDHLKSDVAWASAMVVPTTTVPVVTTVHDLDFLDHPQTLSRRGTKFFPRAWAVAKSRSDLIICPSKFVADRCINDGTPAERVEVVHWGVRTPDVAPEAPKVVNDLGIEGDYLLWVGTKEPRKNLTRLVEAFNKSSAKQLVLVGPKGWDREYEKTELGSGVITLSSVDDKTLDALYRGSQGFVFPSIAEGFGLPILEAMVRGIPVITSDAAAMAEVAGDAALLVDPLSVDSIADAITELSQSSQLRDDLALRGKAHSASFTWDAAAAGYLEAFEAVV